MEGRLGNVNIKQKNNSLWPNGFGDFIEKNLLYGGKSLLLSLGSKHFKPGHSSSSTTKGLWRDIQKVKDIINANMASKIGDGSSLA